MIKEFYITIILFLFYSSFLVAQEFVCGITITSDDIEAQKEFVNSLKSTINSEIRYFPIQAHIIRDSNGEGGISESTVEFQISLLSSWADDDARQCFIRTTKLSEETITSNLEVIDDVIIINNVTIGNNAEVTINACATTIIQESFEANVGSTLVIE